MHGITLERGRARPIGQGIRSGPGRSATALGWALVVLLMVASLVVASGTPEGASDDPATPEVPSAAATAALSGASETVGVGEVPSGLTETEWSDIQRQIAARDVAGSAPALADVGPVFVPTLTVGDSVTFAFDVDRVAVAWGNSGFSLRTTSVNDAAAAPASATQTGRRVVYDRGSYTEWYQTVPGGLEQGFTFAEATDRLSIVQSVRGAEVTIVDPTTARFTLEDGTLLRYAGLYSYDATGRALPSELTAVTGGFTISVDATGAVFPVVVDPIISEDFVIPAPANASGELFGETVAVDADTMIAVARLDDDTGRDAGKVEVYGWDGSVTSFDSAHYPPNTSSATNGNPWDLEIKGDTFLVGVPGDDRNGTDAGAVHVYRDGGGGWALDATLYACDTAGCDPTIAPPAGTFAGENFGFSLAMSAAGDRILIGAPNQAGGGVVYAIGYDGGSYVVDDVFASSGTSAAEDFGWDVDLTEDGNFAIVGQPRDNTQSSEGGSAWLFSFDGNGAAVERSALLVDVPPDNSHFGASVAIVNTGVAYAAVGQPFATRLASDPNGQGAVSLFNIDDIDSPARTQTIPDPDLVGNFGFSLDANSSQLVVGGTLAPTDGDGNGQVSLFTIDAGPAATLDHVSGPQGPGSEEFVAGFGHSVDIDQAGSVAAGAPRFDGTDGADQGQVEVWNTSNRTSPTKVRIASFPDGLRDRFGFAVAIDGDRMAVSAIDDDEPNTQSGVVHIFERVGPGQSWSVVATIRDPAAEFAGRFGDAVALRGDTVAIGKSDRLGDASGPGTVFLFGRGGLGEWGLLVGGIQTSGLATYDAFGSSLAFVDDRTLAIGAPEANGAGAVYVAVKPTFVWEPAFEVGYATAPLPGDQLGYSVAGDVLSTGQPIVLTGAPGVDTGGADAGALEVFSTSEGGFETIVELSASGGDWDAGTAMGTAVAVAGPYLVGGSIPDGEALVYPFRDGLVDPVVRLPIPDLTPGPFDFPNAYLSASGNAIAVGASNTTTGGRAIVYVNRGDGWLTEPTELIPSGAALGDDIGHAVALDGMTLVAGAPGTSSATGVAETGVVYTAEVTLTFLDPGSTTAGGFGFDDDQYGYSVAIDGDFLAVGQPEPLTPGGTLSVFERVGGGWTLTDRIRGDAVGHTGAEFAKTLALDGTRLVAGDPTEGGGTGAIYHFEISGGFLDLQERITGTDQFGASLDIDGSLLVVGSTRSINPFVTVYQLVGGTWVLDQQITPADVPGLIPSSFAIDVAVDETYGYLAVGDSTQDAGGTAQGAVYVFEQLEGSWDFDEEVTAGATAEDAGEFGRSVDLDPGLLVVGQPGASSDGGFGSAGRVTVFESGTWSPVASLDAGADAQANARLGQSVAIDDRLVAAGAYVHDDGVEDVGLVAIFENDGASWSLQTTEVGTSAEGDTLGWVVDIDGTTVAAGAPHLSGDLEGPGVVRTIAATEPPVDVVRWTGAVSSGFHNPGNWDPAVVPGPDQTAIFPDGSPFAYLQDPVEVGVIDLDTELLIDENGSLAITGGPSGLPSQIRSQGVVVNGVEDTLTISADLVLSGGKITTLPGGVTSFVGPNDITVSGFGAWEQQGVLNKDNTGTATIENSIAWTSASSSEINVNTGQLALDMIVFEDGTVSIDPGAEIRYADNVSVDAGALYEIGITGPSTSPDDYGRITALGDFDMNGSLGVDLVGHAPTFADSYVVATCGISCGNGLNADLTSPLEATVNANDITLALPPVDGSPVADVDGGWAVVGNPVEGDVYVLRNVAGTWQQAQLISGSPGFGAAVSIDDIYLAIGEPTDNTVHVYVRDSAGTYNAHPESPLSGAAADDYGAALDLAQFYLIVGSPGIETVGIERLTPTTITNEAVIGGSANTGFGRSVAISRAGPTAWVGAPDAGGGGNERGEVLVYQRSGSSWPLVTNHAPADVSNLDGFGSAISADGFEAAVGSPGKGEGEGKAYHLTLVGTTIDEAAIDTGGSTDDRFGAALGLSGDVLIVGVPGSSTIVGYSDNGTGTWASFGGDAGGAGFGAALGIDGDTLFTVATDDGTGIAEWEDLVKIETLVSVPAAAGKLVASSGSDGDDFGRVVAVSGNTVVVGASSADGPDNGNRGGIYVFRDDGAGYEQVQALEPSLAFGSFGSAVALDGDLLVVQSGSIVHAFRRADSTADFVEFDAINPASEGATFGNALAVQGSTVIVGSRNSTAIHGLVDAGAVFVYEEVTEGSPLVLQQTITRSAPTAGDLFGADVALDELTLAVGATRTTVGDGEGRVLVFTRPTVLDPFEAVEAAVLAPETTTGNDSFGSAVDIDGDLIAVGAITAAGGDGAAFVFEGAGDSWTQTELLPSGADTSDQLGAAVSVDGDTVAFGAPRGDAGLSPKSGGEVHVFTRSGGDWVESDGGLTTDDVEAADEVGTAVVLAGGTLFVGAVGEDQLGYNAGAVYELPVTLVEPAGKIISAPGSDLIDGEEGDIFGYAVDIDGDRLVVGAPEWAENPLPIGDVGNGSTGGVYVFLRSGGGWTLEEFIENPVPGDLEGRFGAAVAVSGPWVAVGSPWTAGPGADSGRVHVFNLDSGTTQEIDPGDLGASSLFGRSVDLDGTVLAIGANGFDVPASNTGKVYVYFDAAGTWVLEDEFTGDDADDQLGRSVSVDGFAIAAGTLDNSAPGYVNVYRLDEGGWFESERVDAPDSGSQFGSAVDLDGDQLLIGAPNTPGGGAAYVTAFDGAEWAPLIGMIPTDGPLPDGDFGFDVALDGTLAVVGYRNATTDDQALAGAGVVFGNDTGNWVELQPIAAVDAADNDNAGYAVEVQGSDVFLGAPFDDNSNGFDAGAVYTFDVPPPEDATLLVDVASDDTEVEAGATAISVVDLPPAAANGYGGAGGGIADTSLESIDTGDGTDEPEILTETTIGDLDLAGALLDTILLSDVVVEGGWAPILAGSVFAGLPLQNVSLGEVIDAGLLDGFDLTEIDLASTPIGSIPIGSIALADTPIGSIELPTGQTVCELVQLIAPGASCGATDSLVDLAIQGVPIGSIPIGSIPIGSIPIGSIPIGSIPIGSIELADTPIGSIPIGSIPIGSIPIGSIPIGSIPIGSIPIGSIDVGTVPIGSIPIGSITIGQIALGDLDTGGIAASPIGSIPIGSIPIGSIPIGSIPIGSIPIGSIPIGSIPIGSIGVDGAVIDSTNVGATPIGSIPIGSIDLAQSPIGSIPIGSIPIGSIPIGSIPIGSIPIGSIPIGSIPIGSIDLLLECTLIDCDGDFTLADAQAAGAILPGATLQLLEAVATGVRLSDLVGIDGLTEQDIIDQLATLVPLFLEDFLIFDDMTLADLPAGLPELDLTVLEDLGAALGLVDADALLAAIVTLDEISLRDALAALGILTLADLPNTDGMVLGDLPTDDPDFLAQTIADLLPFMENIRLGDLLALHPTFDENDLDWGTAELADISDWQDVTLGELAEYGGTTLAELIAALPPEVLAELTLADLLLSLLGIDGYDWQEIELAALDLDATSGQVLFTSSFEVGSTGDTERAVRVRTTIPIDGAYAEGSATVQAAGLASAPTGDVEPVVQGNQLEWLLGDIEPNQTYEIEFAVRPSLNLGSALIESEGSIAGSSVSGTGAATVSIVEAFEPNDVVGDLGVVVAESDTIYVSHIAEAGDVDLYAVDLQAGGRLALSLSDLPADFDLAVFGPPIEPLVPVSLRELSPSELPDVSADGSENGSSGPVLEDIPLQDLPLVDVSTKRGTETDAIDVNVRHDGRYYVQVSGYAGAQSDEPYGLFIKTVPPAAPLVCVAQDYTSIPNIGTDPTTVDMTGVNTLIVTNRERLFAKYGADANLAVDAIGDMLTYVNGTNPGLGVNAAVIEVDGSPTIRAAYGALDAASCEPERANDVVREIAALLAQLRAADPATEIEQIMFVGDDDIVPMARLEDATTIANEVSYSTTFLDVANSLLGATLGSYYLSDEPYGDIDPISVGSRVLYLTDTSLGRLVEKPSEIAGQVASFIGFQGLLDPGTALVTGYDFLADGAEAISATLAAQPDVPSVDELINETWTAQQLIDQLFPAADPSPNFAAVNGHYDHYRALPADQNAAGVESDLFTTVDVDDPTRAGALEGRVLWAMGCHGGMSVPDEILPVDTDPRALDWAQAYARQNAVWVGNTGYGYGETEGVELSERLMDLFAARMDGSVTAGEALFYAKQLYLGTQQAQYGPFDEKVLQQTTFYGIPFFQIGVTTPPPPPPLPPQPLTISLPSLNLNFSTIVSDPAFSPVLTQEGTYFEAAIPPTETGVPGDQTTPYTQIEPTESIDVSNVDQATGEPVAIAQGALITGLTTTDVPGIDPDLSRPIVDSAQAEQEPEIGNAESDPGVFVSNFLTPEGLRQRLTALLGTFQSTDPDGTGIQRLFEQIEFEVLYREPADDGDQSKPTFVAVDSFLQPAGSQNVLVIDAVVSDNVPGSVARVLALVAEDPGANTVWRPVEFVNTGGDNWSASVVVTGTVIEFLLQAHDGAGNTALTTNKSQLFNQDGEPPPQPPSDIEVTFSAPPDADPFYASAVTLSAEAGGADIDYRIDGGPIVTGGPGPEVELDPTVLGDGAHLVTFTSGSAARTETVIFDTTSPTVSILSPAAGAVFTEGDVVPATFSCADAASGAATCDALLDGIPIAMGDNVVTTVGGHTLAVISADTVGNATQTSVLFEVEADPQTPVEITNISIDGVALPGETVGLDVEFLGEGTHVAAIDWGDGETCTTPEVGCILMEPTVDDPGLVEATHRYAAGGTFTVSVTITSDTGGSDTGTIETSLCTLIGDNNANTLIGTSGDDIICGRGGHDLIRGRGGNDLIFAGGGNDRVFAGAGDDVVFGGRGSDRLYGSNGDDLLSGGRGADLLLGGNDDDVLRGGRGIDSLFGGGGADELRGGRGDDSLWGQSGADDLFGGRDEDQLFGSSGDDLLVGGGADDAIFGGRGDDEIAAGLGDDAVFELSGTNLIGGGPGDDWLVGGWGPDSISGGPGNDILFGLSGPDVLDGGTGFDACSGGPGADTTIDCEA